MEKTNQTPAVRRIHQRDIAQTGKPSSTRILSSQAIKQSESADLNEVETSKPEQSEKLKQVLDDAIKSSMQKEFDDGDMEELGEIEKLLEPEDPWAIEHFSPPFDGNYFHAIIIGSR